MRTFPADAHPAPEELARELVELDKRGPILLEFDASHAIALAVNLQLALLHPENVGFTAAAARRFIDELKRALESSPAARLVLNAGDDPRYDGRGR